MNASAGSAVKRTCQAPGFGGRRLNCAAAGRRDVTLADWAEGPLQLAAFGPRVLAGAVLSAREKLPLMQEKAQSVANIVGNQPGSWDRKLVRRGCSPL